MRRIFLIIILLVTLVFLVSIYHGGKLGDFVETETVGSVMCLSCMGIE